MKSTLINSLTTLDTQRLIPDTISMSRISGMLFFIAGFLILMGITTAEVFFPSYSVRNDFISTLGSTPPPDSIIFQPSATIFDTAMIIAGILIIIGSLISRNLIKDKLLFVFLLLMGIGTAGVGFFPANTGAPHIISAAMSFIAGGIAAIISFRVLSSPFKYLSVILGSLSLIFLFSGEFLGSYIVPILGTGGTERFVAYPITIWILGFGGYLMNRNNSKS